MKKKILENMDFFFVNRWVLKFAGLWEPESKHFLIQSLYFVYSTLVFLFVNLFFTSTEIISFFYTYKHLDDFIKNVNFALTHVMGAFKVIFWYFTSYKLKNLIKILQNEKFTYKNYGNFKPEEAWKKYKKIGMIETLIFFFFGQATILSSYIPPVVFTIMHIFSDEKLPTNILPYYSWIPFPYDTPKCYLIALIYQFGPMYSYAFSIVGIDTMLANIMNCITCHITIIQGAFFTIAERTVSEKSLQNGKLSNLEHFALNLEMKKICKHLQTILKICKELESVQKYLVFCQAMATLFILCTSLYLVSTKTAFSEDFYNEVVFLLAMWFQVLLYCWFGNEVTLKIQEIPMYIWRSNWYATNHSFKMSMIFTMLRLRKPIYFTIGNFAPLTLTTFMSIMKTSYSFFAVINNTD